MNIYLLLLFVRVVVGILSGVFGQIFVPAVPDVVLEFRVADGTGDFVSDFRQVHGDFS
jgi:predicted MFS family arabinose efflux permease